MTREDDIVERLREYARNCGGPPEDYLTWQAADEIERLQAAIAWTREVRPGKNAESGGAIVHMTWDQFNAMRALAEPKP